MSTIPSSPVRKNMANAAYNAANIQQLGKTYDNLLTNFFLTGRTAEVVRLTKAMDNLIIGMKNKMAYLTTLNDLLTYDNRLLKREIPTSLLKRKIPEIKKITVADNDNDAKIQKLEETYDEMARNFFHNVSTAESKLDGLTTAMRTLREEMKRQIAELTTLNRLHVSNNNYLRLLIEQYNINITTKLRL